MVMAMWFPPVGTFGILLAIAGFIVSIVGFQGKTRIVLAGACILLGLGEIVSIIKADAAHDAEVKQQHADVEGLRSDLQKSELQRAAESAYLRAKIEDYDKFGPALMLMAKTGAEFQRKQYENKVQTEKELYDFTMDVVKRIRALEAKYNDAEEKARADYDVARRGKITIEDNRGPWNDYIAKSTQLSTMKDREFRDTILPDALYARGEMWRRHIPEPVLDPMNRAGVDSALRGMLAGPYPEMSLAVYLEDMAKHLRH